MFSMEEWTMQGVLLAAISFMCSKCCFKKLSETDWTSDHELEMDTLNVINGIALLLSRIGATATQPVLVSLQKHRVHQIPRF